jgi:hypothetical protein
LSNIPNSPDTFPIKPSGAWIDLGRAIILIVGVIALSGVTLVLLPQSAVDKIAAHIESRHNVTGHEKIALLYLADEFTDGAFRIRGVIRNIDAAPAERIDAIVRLYNRERELLETVIVRLDKDFIEPNDFARLELTIPGHTAGFAGYAVEFKLREGGVLPYKDMRRQSPQNPNP